MADSQHDHLTGTSNHSEGHVLASNTMSDDHVTYVYATVTSCGFCRLSIHTVRTIALTVRWETVSVQNTVNFRDFRWFSANGCDSNEPRVYDERWRILDARHQVCCACKPATANILGLTSSKLSDMHFNIQASSSPEQRTALC